MENLISKKYSWIWLKVIRVRRDGDLIIFHPINVRFYLNNLSDVRLDSQTDLLITKFRSCQYKEHWENIVFDAMILFFN